MWFTRLILFLLLVLGQPWAIAGWLVNPYKFVTAAGGPPAFVTANTGASGTGGGTATVSITPSGTNRYLLVGVTSFASPQSNSTPSSVTFNGTGMTNLVTSTFISTDGNFSVWGLVNPAAVTGNVVVTFVASGGNIVAEYSVACAAFSGVNQTTPLGTGASDLSDTARTSTSTTPGSATTDLVAAVVCYDATFSVTNGSSITTRATASVSGFDGTRIATKPGAAGTTTMDFTLSGSGVFKSWAVALKP